MTRPETPSTVTTTPSRSSTSTSSPASSRAHRQNWAQRHQQAQMPDAYLSETLHAPAQGVGVVTRPGHAPALTWDGHQVGQVTAAHLGGYQFSPAHAGRGLGPIVTTEQLEVLAARFGQGGRGLDLRAPARLTLPAVRWPLRRAPREATCPRCGGAFPQLSHEFTGELLGRECLTCEYAEDLQGRPIPE